MCMYITASVPVSETHFIDVGVAICWWRISESVVSMYCDPGIIVCTCEVHSVLAFACSDRTWIFVIHE